MEKRIGVLHHGKLAQYNISEKKNGHFIARLLNYIGNQREVPPAKIDLHKEGRHWVDEGADQDLVDEIGYAIEQEKDVLQKPVFHNLGNNHRNDINTDRDKRKHGGKP